MEVEAKNETCHTVVNHSELGIGDVAQPETEPEAELMHNHDQCYQMTDAQLVLD